MPKSTTPEKITVRPARPGLLVPNPENKHEPLKADGETVTQSTYWRRRLLDKDVVIVKPAAPAQPRSKSKE
ncbi:MAG: DUF2635 domain-containing protein [Alphaproteobacteria bacterium]|nr:DUF2635 domain-containing protein [Alphaproteobacteria bacterium]